MSHRIVVDLGYGDAGKGTVTDWLCRRQPTAAVVRYNGGAQAAHNVVTGDGRHHTFSQFGSGTFAGARTHLSRFVLVDPFRLSAEAAHLVEVGVPDPMALLTVDPDAPLVTPYHRAANRERERARGDGRHGSCGVGIGETRSYAIAHPEDAPRVGDCRPERPSAALRAKLAKLRSWVADEFPALDADALPAVQDLVDAYRAFGSDARIAGEGALRALLRSGPCVFEGAQGVLLDESYGFHPFTTWTDTTTRNARTLLSEAGTGTEATSVGVVRAYMTRHGPGPFVTEDPALDLPEGHNKSGEWQGAWRVGHFDAVACRYAIEVSGGVDELAVTHLDRVRPQLAMAVGYRWPEDPARFADSTLAVSPEPDLGYQAYLTDSLFHAVPVYDRPAPGEWVEAIEDELERPVTLESYGPAAGDKRPGRSRLPAVAR